MEVLARFLNFGSPQLVHSSTEIEPTPLQDPNHSRRAVTLSIIMPRFGASCALFIDNG